MNKSRLRKAWKWFKIIALLYIMIGVALYFLQDKFIFHPKKLAADYQYQFDVPFREIELPVTDEKMISIVQFTVPDSIRKGVVLYFHGNRTNINRYAVNAGLFTKNGYEAWMIDYPGYGKSTGKRSEKVLYDDALLFYKMAISRVPAEQIIIYGRSLGSGIASQLASVRDCQRVILETPYYSMDALARHYFFMYPVMPMTKYTLPTYQHLDNVRSPVTIFHGTKDQVIPYKHAKWLAGRKRGTELVTIDKGKHNNLAEFPQFRQKLDSLLSR
jgi:alpha-beta hydrolase superfamily lysophospholipase